MSQERTQYHVVSKKFAQTTHPKTLELLEDLLVRSIIQKMKIEGKL